MFYGVSGGHAIWPKCLDRIIIFGNNYKSMAVKYEIVCAIYGSNAHFICRYFRRGKVYEADGMRELLYINKRSHSERSNEYRDM